MKMPVSPNENMVRKHIQEERVHFVLLYGRENSYIAQE
jgi:hypothetical protein